MYPSKLKKSVLRKLYLKERQSLSKEEIEEYSQVIFKNFLNCFDLYGIKKVHCFLPIEKFKEVNTVLFIEYFWENNIDVFVPKIIGEKIISIRFERSTEMEENSWGILEPKSDREDSKTFDMVITPLLYCDRNGNRIGYGKGFYDQFFRKINLDVVKVGLNIFSPQQEISDLFEKDIPLDYLLTPTEVLSFGNSASISTK